MNRFATSRPKGNSTDVNVNEKTSGASPTGHSHEISVQSNSRTRVRKVFSHAQIFFFALTFMNSWEAIGTNVGVAFYNGGPRALVWGFFIVIPGTLCQVASISEMASVQPIAGAQYVWTHYYAPKNFQRPITWVQGWITWFSWIAITAGTANVIGNIITTLVTVSYPDYVAKSWHTLLIMYSILMILALLNQFAFWLIPWIEMAAGLLHIILFIVFASVLATLGQRHSSDFVFFSKSNLSGWNNDFVSFNLGIILITWGFVGFDGAIHMSEEVRKARHAVPRAMFLSICLNSGLAFAMTIIYLYFLGPVEDVLAAYYGLVPIVINATGSVQAGSAMIGCFMITVLAVMLGCIASSSRLTWAWSRDGALPQWFGYVDSKYRVPVRSLWVSVLIVAILLLLNLASAVAIGVVISLGTFGLFQSYFIAIGCMLWGYPINIAAMIYTAWVGTFTVFPNYLPITSEYMNYALPINVGVWIFAGVTWFAWARKNWRGLNMEVFDAVLADADRATKD
ncbi:Choline transport protein [Cyphellophora attinorum]|uniref:Choline transport protein n=1 Tax=Cyphellophora attinorum TaxID=1664694 RepID=A0A0N1HTJ7_9EURO|nr:Choline transport protein [Phialophora attinorum]KPI42372.1 Choline transport protein [Phialophora attinorum]